MAHVYTANDVSAIIAEAFRRGWETKKNLAADAPMPEPPTLQEIVDHPYTGSNAPGQYKRPWLNDPRGKRGLAHDKNNPRADADGDRKDGSSA